MVIIFVAITAMIMQTLGNGLVLLHVIDLWEYNRVSDLMFIVSYSK
jgi:predicted ABC-type sugar transport system permease subunit